MPTTELTASEVIKGVKITISARFPVVGLLPAFEYEPIGSQDFYDPDFQSLMAAGIVRLLRQAVLEVDQSHLAFSLASIKKMKTDKQS